MTKLAEQLVPIKLDAEKEGAELAKKYKVRGYPTILFLEPNGDVFGTIGGYMPPDGFSAEMSKNINLYKELPKLEEALKKNPDDPAANAKMIPIHAARGKIDLALAALGKAEKGNLKGPELAQAYNAVGDHYQLSDKLDEAIPYFKKADAAATTAADRSYAKVSLMYCYLGKQDNVNAKKYAQELIALKDVTPEYKKMAEQVLERIGG